MIGLDQSFKALQRKQSQKDTEHWTKSMVDNTACKRSFHEGTGPWAAIKDCGDFPVVNDSSPQGNRLGLVPEKRRVVCLLILPSVLSCSHGPCD